MCRTKSAFLKTGAGAERRFAITNCYAAGPHDAVERYRPFHDALEVKGRACFAGYGVATADAGWPDEGGLTALLAGLANRVRPSSQEHDGH